MTQKEQPSVSKDTLKNYWRPVLIILSAVLTFIGPTYVPYFLLNILHVDYLFTMLFGIGTFIVGLGLLLFVTKKKF